MSGSTVRSRLIDAGLALPGVDAPRSRYVPLRVHAGVAYCAGVTSDGMTGVVGDDATVEEAMQAARHAALRQLAYVESGLGSLDVVADVLRLTGYVCCRAGFAGTPDVVDAASVVYLNAFGPEHGRHARSAIGVAGLPGGALIELEVVLALRDPGGR